MPIFGQQSYARPRSNYVGSPVDEVRELTEKSSDQYYRNRARKDELDLLANSIDVREYDAPVKQKALERIRGRLSDIEQQGDWENANNAVNDAAKEFYMDKELQGAQMNRQREVQYYQDQAKRFQEGKIDQDDYERQLQETRSNNAKPIKYNPQTMQYEGVFKGSELLDSKAKEIYENAYKRIEGWKDGALTIDGKNYYKTYRDGMAYIVDDNKNGVSLDEVYDALSREIKNRPDYMSYINQKRDTAMWQRYHDPSTGQVLPITKDHLIRDFDLSNDEIKSIATKGRVSQSSLDKLLTPTKLDEQGKTVPKTKKEITADKELYRIQKKEYDEADINNLNTQELASLYGQLYVNDKVKEYVMPAAEKASFQKFDRHWREDKLMLLDYEHKLKKDLEKYKQKVTNPVYANIENRSVAETISHKDLEDTFQNLYQTNSRIKDVEAKYGKDALRMPKDIANQYNEDLANQKIMEASKSQVYEAMKNNGHDILGKAKNFIFANSTSSNNENAFNEYVKSKEVQKLPAVQAYMKWLSVIDKDKTPEERLQAFGGDVSKYTESFKRYTGFNTLDELSNFVGKQVENDPELSKHFEAYVDNAVNAYKHILKPSRTGPGDNTWGQNIGYSPLGQSNKQLASFEDIGQLVENEEEKYFEDKSKKILQLDTSVLSTDDKLDYKGEAKGSDPVNKYTHQWNDLLQNNTGFRTLTGRTPNEIVAEYNKDKDKKDKKMNLKDLNGRIATKAIDGKFALVVSLPDNTTKLFFPENQAEMARTLKDIGTKYIENAGDAETQQKGVQMLSQVNFNNLKKIIPDAHLNNREKGDVLPIDLPIRNGDISTPDIVGSVYQKFGLRIKDKLSNGASIVQIVDQNGNPSKFDAMFNEIGGKNEFNDMNELMYNLEVRALAAQNKK